MRAGPDRFVREIVQTLVFRIAQNQPIARVPEYEGFGNGTKAR